MDKFKEFSNDSEFRQFVYSNICQCFNQCINVDLKMVPNKQSVCTEILVNKNDPVNICYYDYLLENSIILYK
jgi:hypothetical protein